LALDVALLLLWSRLQAIESEIHRLFQARSPELSFVQHATKVCLRQNRTSTNIFERKQ